MALKFTLPIYTLDGSAGLDIFDGESGVLFIGKNWRTWLFSLAFLAFWLFFLDKKKCKLCRCVVSWAGWGCPVLGAQGNGCSESTKSGQILWRNWMGEEEKIQLQLRLLVQNISQCQQW